MEPRGSPVSIKSQRLLFSEPAPDSAPPTIIAFISPTPIPIFMERVGISTSAKVELDS